MADTIKVVVTEDLRLAMGDAISDGDYVSETEIVREALDIWQSNRQPADADALRVLWNEGIASGEAAELDMRSIKAAARRRWKERSEAV